MEAIPYCATVPVAHAAVEVYAISRPRLLCVNEVTLRSITPAVVVLAVVALLSS